MIKVLKDKPVLGLSIAFVMFLFLGWPDTRDTLLERVFFIGMAVGHLLFVLLYALPSTKLHAQKMIRSLIFVDLLLVTSLWLWRIIELLRA